MTKSVSRKDLYVFGLKLGLFSFIRIGDLKIALKRIILPVNYWRVSIFKIVAEHLINYNSDKEKKIKILDIGSPKLLSLFLASKLHATIFATDLQDKTIFLEWKKLYETLSCIGNVVFEYADAKKLKYPDNYFDIIYSLSVIHMITPGKNGDIMALKEIQKKICPGGLLIIEVPYRNQYVENYAHRNNFEERYCGDPIFQERQYDEASIEDRIIKNISGNLLKKVYLYELFPFDIIWNRFPNFITMLLAFLEPWADMCNIFIAHNKRQSRKAKSIVLFFEISKLSHCKKSLSN